MERKTALAILGKLLLITTLALAFIIQPIKAEPGTIMVPDDYPTLQEAIDQANIGDTILVSSGTYYENLVINKAVSIVGKDPISTIVEGSGGGNIISVEADYAKIENLTVTSSEYNDKGIAMESVTNCDIRNNRISNIYGDYGLYLSYSSNNVISRNSVEGSWNGLYLSFSSSNDILENSIMYNGYGLYLVSSHGNDISGNNMSYSESVGFYLDSSSMNSISGNRIEYCRGYSRYSDGLVFSSSSLNTLRNNSIAGCDFNMEIRGAEYADFVNDVDASNTVEGKPIFYWIDKKEMVVPSDAGYVVLVNCTRITVQNLDHADRVFLAYTTNSTVIGNTLFSGYCLDLHFSSGNTISGNDISGTYAYNSYCISISFSSNNTVFGNRLSSNQYGLALSRSSHNSVSGNILKSCGSMKYGGYGIELLDSSYNSVSGNNITDSERGFNLGSSSNNRISGNNIENSYYDGIELWGSSDNIVSENNIVGNGCGFYLDSSPDNSIHHNNFIGNALQVSSDGSPNTWDNGYPSGGNYWSDYTNVDLRYGPNQNLVGPDGIWDHPYVIDANNVDRYPLVKAWPVIPTTVDIFPDSVSLRSLRAFFTVYIELPYGYSGQNIDVSTIRLNNIVKPEPRPIQIGDYDHDGIPDLMVKFSGPNVKPLLHVGTNTLTVSGMVNARPFVGSDTIKVVR